MKNGKVYFFILAIAASCIANATEMYAPPTDLSQALALARKSGGPTVINLAFNFGDVQLKDVISTVNDGPPIHTTLPNGSWLVAHQKTIKQKLRSFMINNKKLICLTSILGIYGSVEAILLHAKYRLTHAQLWSAWNNNTPLKKLISSSTQELTNNLISDIYIQYPSTNNKTDQITPIARFTHAIEKEKRWLKFYEQTLKLIHKMRFKKILPYSAQVEQLVEKHQERLAYVEKIFTSWALSCTVTSTQKTT